MEWNRSETLILAANTCTTCRGKGLHAGRGGAATPCNCVLRTIFRECLNRFQHCSSKEKSMSKVTMETGKGKERRGVWGRKDEEYIADFLSVSRRALSENEHRLFRYHYLLAADWKMCCRRLNIDRGTFYHEIYKIQEKLGRTYRDLQPYGLFPLDEYFRGATKEDAISIVPIRPKIVTWTSKIPVKKAA